MKRFLLLAGVLSLIATTPLHASFTGHEGGGGDATEMRVDEIRSDILDWINKGGPKN